MENVGRERPALRSPSPFFRYSKEFGQRTEMNTRQVSIVKIGGSASVAGAFPPFAHKAIWKLSVMSLNRKRVVDLVNTV